MPKSFPPSFDKLLFERTKLASERTFLAWLQTALGSIGLGILIARLLPTRLDDFFIKQIGLLMMVWGIAIIIFALKSYQKGYQKLKRLGIYQENIRKLRIASLALLFLSCLLLWIAID